MRAGAVGVGAANITALLLTHLHSDHITDLSDVITTRWVTTFTRTPLPVIGPPGTAAVVDATLAALAPDISYRIAHHADITEPPVIEVHEYTDGPVWDDAGVTIRVAPTYHRPVEPDHRLPHRIRRRFSGIGRGYGAMPRPGRIVCRGGGAGAHGDPQGHRRATAPAADQGHPRLPLVGAGGGVHRVTRRRGHPRPDALRAAAGTRDRKTSGARWRPRSSTARSNSVTTCTASRSIQECAPAVHDATMTIPAQRRRPS